MASVNCLLLAKMVDNVKNASYSLMEDTLTWTCCHNRTRQLRSTWSRRATISTSVLLASLACDQALGWYIHRGGSGGEGLPFIKPDCLPELILTRCGQA
jgi:hypothetical protein